MPYTRHSLVAICVPWAHRQAAGHLRNDIVHQPLVHQTLMLPIREYLWSLSRWCSLEPRPATCISQLPHAFSTRPKISSARLVRSPSTNTRMNTDRSRPVGSAGARIDRYSTMVGQQGCRRRLVCLHAKDAETYRRLPQTI